MSNKGKRGKKKEANNSQHSKRELITREDGQEYGLCITMLGCDQVKVHLFTGQDAIGMIRGKMVTRVKSRKLQPGNVVLCGTREFESRGLKVDILLHYTPDEVVELQALGEIPRQNGSLSHGTITEATGRGHISFKRAKSEESLSRASHGWVMPLTDEDTDVDGITDNDDAHDVPDEMKLRSSKEDHHSAKRSHDERRALSSWNAQRLERAAATPDSMDSTEGEAPPYYEHHMMHPTAYEHGMSLVEEEEDTTPAHEDEVRRTEYQAWGNTTTEHGDEECEQSAPYRRAMLPDDEGDTGHAQQDEVRTDQLHGAFRGVCYNCNQEGHLSRNCPFPRVGSSGGRGGACYNCGQEGHMSRDCPYTRAGPADWIIHAPALMSPDLHHQPFSLFDGNGFCFVPYDRLPEYPPFPSCPLSDPIQHHQKVFVGQLLDRMTECDIARLCAYFSGFPMTASNVVIMQRRDGSSTGSGFVYLPRWAATTLLQYSRLVYCHQDGLWIARDEPTINAWLRDANHHGRGGVVFELPRPRNRAPLLRVDYPLARCTTFSHDPYSVTAIRKCF